jgi:hypothetical protein
MAIPLVPFAIGALTELERQREITDDVAGKAVDLMSKQVIGIEIPTEQNLIKKQNAIRDVYEAKYGPEATTVLDAYGIFESGDENSVSKKFQSFLGSTSVDKFVSNAKSLANTDKKLYNQLISQSFISKRQLKLEDRKTKVDKIMKGTPHIRDFIVKPEEERKGILGAMIPTRLEQRDLPMAGQRLMEATQAEDLDKKDLVSLMSIRDKLGIVPGSAEPKLELRDAIAILNSARNTYKLNNIYKNFYDTPEIQKEFNQFKRTDEGKKYKGTINDYAFETYYLPQEIKKIQTLRGIPQEQTKTQTQQKTTLTGNELLVSQAKEAINKIRASNVPDADKRIESIKQDLRNALGVTNLSDYNL